MSNRNLAFLILISFCAAIIWAIYYFFIANVGNIEIDVWGLKWVKIELNWQFQNNETITCDNKCSFIKKPPINYTLIATKDTYKIQKINFKLERSNTKKIQLTLSKDVQSESVKITKEERLKTLKYNKLIASKSEDSWIEVERIVIWNYNWKIYSYTNKEDMFYIYESDWESENEVFSQKELKVKNLWINVVDWIIYYNTQEDKYFFDIKLKSNFKIDLSDELILVKKTPINAKYIINTINWIYLYNTENSDYSRNTLYDDFIVLNSWKILGLIYPESIEKLSILNFDNNKKTKIILHDISTISRKVIYETTMNIKYIFNDSWEVKYLDKNMKLYNLKQLDIE